MSVRLTVGIPFHNEEHFLGAAIRSVLRQTMSDFELLLIDDGSTDRSLEVARGFHDSRIVVSSDGVRRGLAARLNEIVARAKGDLIARMDGDDLCHPTRFARELEALEVRRECSLVGTWAALIDENEVPFAVVESARLPASREVALSRGILVHASIVGRREWHRRFPYDAELTRAEDRDLWSRSVEVTQFCVIPEPLYMIRTRPHDAGFIGDYLESQAQNRMLYLKHGPRVWGLPRLGGALLKSYAKSLVMRAGGAVGLTAQIVRRRGRAPTAAERQLIHESLALD